MVKGMTREQIIIIVLAAWVGAGLASMLWMARRGHRDPLWLLGAVLLGPVLAFIAPDRIERSPKVLSTERHGKPDAGTRVLIGVDGSAESLAALQSVLALLRRRIGWLVVAEVVDYDTAEDDWRQRQAAARQHLAAARTLCGEHAVSCELLAGPPGQALAERAQRDDIDLIVVGRRGHGLSVRLLGSVAEYLARTALVPVLISGTTTAAGQHGLGADPRSASTTRSERNGG